MESSRQEIENRATELLLKRESETWSPRDQEELVRWMDASTANRVAFLRAEAAWEEMGRLKALGAGLPPRSVPTPESVDAIDMAAGSAEAVTQAPRRYRAVVGIAASIAALVGIAFASYGAWFSGERYATPIGGVASLPLEDGSRITLNTGSKVRVLFSERQRVIELSRGEAFFEVAHDSSRPFVVRAAGRNVVAVGTKFSVRRDADLVQVVVTEGRVSVDNPDAERSEGPQVATSGRAAPIMLSAGAVVRARNAELVVKNHPLPEAEEILSWRSGDVIFRETRLEDAVAEFNRYNARQIVIRDPSVAGMQLTGKFRATNSDAFVNLLQQTYGIDVERTDATIVLTARAVASHE